MDCYNIINHIKSQKATLLWEYNFNLKKEDFDFEKIESKIYNPHNSKECKEALVAIYLFHIALEMYRMGDFWGDTILKNDPNERGKFYEYFRDFLKKYNLFTLNSKRKSPKEFLIHAVVPKYYSNNFLDIAKKFYENEDDLEYLQYIDDLELKSYFNYSIQSIKELISHKETSIIIKDLLYRTVKTFENYYNQNYENIYNLPNWFFEATKSFLQNRKIHKKISHLTFLKNGYVKINFDLEEDLYFFDEDRKLIKIVEDNGIIYFTKEPKYIVINKNLDDFIDEIENYFSSPSSRWDILENDYYCYELENELIGESLGDFECKEFEKSKNKIELEGINREFPFYLKSDIPTYFDGIKIKNYSAFSKIFLNDKEVREPILKLKRGIYELKAISGLGNIIESKNFRILPFYKIEKLDNKIYVKGEPFDVNSKITIDGVDFEYENIEIFLRNSQIDTKENIILFRQIQNYHILINYVPSYIKHLKIVYVDSSENIVDTKRVSKNSKKIEISQEIKENLSFPVKIYLEHRDLDGYKKSLIGMIYLIEIEKEKDCISIYPDIDRFRVVIQSRYDIFSKPLKTEEKIIKYKDFPNPKFGDFDVTIYDKRTNNIILREGVTNGHLNSDNQLINYFKDTQNFVPPLIKFKYLKNFLKNLKYLNYQFLDKTAIEKLNLLLEGLYKRFSKAIDDFIRSKQINIEKIRYMILFDKKFSIKLNNDIEKVDENVLLSIKIKFPNEIKSILDREVINSFLKILEKNQKEDRVKIFEILEYPAIQKIVNQAVLKETHETQSDNYL